MYVEKCVYVCRKICKCRQKNMYMYVEKYVYVCRKKLRTTKMTKSKKDKKQITYSKSEV